MQHATIHYATALLHGSQAARSIAYQNLQIAGWAARHSVAIRSPSLLNMPGANFRLRSPSLIAARQIAGFAKGAFPTRGNGAFR